MSGDQPISELKINLWMPLDIGPFLQDTAHLSAEEIGAYTLLLLYYWAHGPLPNDPKRLANIAKMSADTWSITHEALSMYFFEGSDGLLHQKGADRRRAQWLDKRLKAREKALKAINARWSKHRAKVASQSNTPSIPEEVRGEVLANYPTSVNTSTKTTHTPTPTPGAGAGDESKIIPSRQLGTSKSETRAKPGKTAAAAHPKGATAGKVQASVNGSVARHRTRGARAHNFRSDPENAGPAAENPESVNQAKFPGELKAEVFQFWAGAGIGEFECPWSDLEDRASDSFLKQNPKIDLPHFKQLLRNRAASEGINRADPPHKWLRSLVKYADGPLDRFGKPLRPARVH
jgi:uncharacterized protein YdaU (DUF1376 family)